MASVRKTVELEVCPVSISRFSLFMSLFVALAITAISVLSTRVAEAQATASTPTASAVNVTTYHNDIGRTGQNLNETILTPSNVNASQFGLLFSQAVDGQVYAEPLYMSGLTVNGATHNVVYVATENDSIYAFDADTNAGVNASPLWQASMLAPAHGAASGATAISSTNISTDIQPLIGISGTPVIDPTTNTMYVVSADLENGNAVQRLHALDITTGNEKFGGPVAISASVPGTGNGSSNGTLTFDSYWQNQRGGLLLLNGIVYMGFGSHGDNGPWHGWIMGYNATTLAQTGAICTSPNGTGGGVWGAGAGLAADQLDTVNHPFGRMFVPTGNGDYTATTPYTSNMDYGDSELDLDLTNGVPTITDDFTSTLQGTLDSGDLDQGSGGLMVIPTQTTGAYPHLAVQAGKRGTLFLLNRDGLGGYNTSNDSNAAQALTYAVGNVGVWATPAYWNGNIYVWGQDDTLKDFALTNGTLSSTPTVSSETYGYPGATPTISANGATNGIVWSVNSNGYPAADPAILQAHNASNVATTLYSSLTNSGRDTPGPAVKFSVPTVVNGKVYLGTANQIDIYGLLNGATQVQTPVLTPGAETFNGSISVTIADATTGASIYYTTSGAAATPTSTLYTGPITVSSTETINAIATASGLISSAQASATYTSVTQTATVVFNLPTGTYGSAQTVSLSDTTANAVIYYTTDGTTPTTASAVYSTPFTVSASETITAFAMAPNLSPSPAVGQTYTISASQSGIFFGQGFSASSGSMILNGSTDLDDSRLQLTDGGSGEAGSAWYARPVNIQAFTTDFTFQLSNPSANGITFAIQNAPSNVNALGGNSYDLGYAPITNSIAIKFDLYNSNGEGSDSTGLYLNGAIPTVPSIDLSTSGINLHSGDTMSVHLTYDGTTLSMTITDEVTGAVWSTSWTVNIPSAVGASTAYVGFTGGTGGLSASQKILTWSFVTGSGTPTVATPTFSPVAGTYATAQTVAISDSTANSTIYYTTNGTTPTTASMLYSSPITVSTTATVSAIAIESGYANSGIGTAAYTINNTLAPPVFSPAGGSYTSVQAVTISDVNSSASIYYTTNGSAPTASSTLYTGPITVGATETINAIAVASGLANSVVASASYTISIPVTATPTFSMASGIYAGAQSVTLSDATSGATIYYTLDGSTPTTTSAVYASAINVSATETINAIALASGYSVSSVGSATYTIGAALPVINFPNGFGTGPASINTYGAVYTNGALQLTDTNGGENRVAWFQTPVNVQAFTTDFTFQETSAVANGFTFSLQNASANVYAVGGSGSGLGYSGITPSVAVKFDLYTPVGAGTDSTGFYTNGALPTTPAVDMSTSGVNLASGDVLHAHITYDGTTLTLTLTDTVTNAVFTTSQAINIPTTVGASTAYVGFTGGTGAYGANQNILAWTYTVGAPAVTTALPVFLPTAGTYPSAQSVTISDATSGAIIYYTTNGAAPTTSSAVYSGPITVGVNETINAIAAVSGVSSPVASAAYTITGPAATPTFLPLGGSYTSTQSVTISDANSGATIYYTTNGTAPTTSSAVYTGPISVSATETINALAVASGYANSSVGSAAYTIAAVTAPTFTAVNLSSVYNVYGIFNAGVAPTNGGLDSAGYALPSNLLGASVTWSGVTFPFGTAGAADAVSNATIPLPAGAYATLSLVATGAYGPLTNQAFVVTYSDGTTTTFTQSVSDWGKSQSFAGESVAGAYSYRVTQSGTTQAGPWNLYGYSFALNSSKIVSSIKLPAIRNVVVFGMALTGQVPLTTQTITFGTIAGQTVGGTLALTGTASSGLAVSYASTTPTICTVSGSTASMISAGTCTIAASQAGNTTYAAASTVAQSFTVSAQSQTITFPTIPAQALGSTYTLSATASSGLAVAYASTTPTICTVSGSIASSIAVGTCSITASQTGNSTYAAAPLVSQSFGVGLKSQTITFGSIASQTVGGTLSLSGTATSSLAVAYASSTPTICTVSVSTASLIAAGTCTITASQAGNSTYAAASSVTQSFAVSLKAQTITFGTIASQSVGGTLSLTGSATSGLAVAYASSTSTICTVSGSTASLLAAGTCTITASQAGNSTYAAATSVSQSFAVGLKAQTITFGTIASQKAGATLALTGTASSGLAVSFASSTPTICTVSGSNSSLIAAGTCTITASQAGNSTYAAATSVPQSFTVTAATTTTPTAVSLSSAFNVYGIFNNGSAVTNGGLDTSSYAYSANLLGSSVTWSGTTFTLGNAGKPSAVTGSTITLPAGKYSSLQFLGCSVFGPLTNQSFVVTYSDGTTTTFSQSMSDWGRSQSYTNESVAGSYAYRVTPTGGTQTGPWNIYGYTLTLNSAKTVSSIKLPGSRDALVLAMSLNPVQTYSISGTISGTGGNGATVTLSGATTATATASSSGTYSFAGLAAGSYTVTPTHAGYTFTPASMAVSIGTANATANFSSAGYLIANGTYTITNKNSGQVIDDPGFSTTTGTDLIQYGSNGGSNQKWVFTNLGNNYVHIASSYSNDLIEVYNLSTANGGPIDQWPNNNGTNQVWQVVSVTGGYYELINENSGKALEVPNSSTTQAQKLDQSTTTGAANQLWTIK